MEVGRLRYNSLTAEGNLSRLEPRGTTMPHHATELTWEVYWGCAEEAPGQEWKEERGSKEGLLFIRGYSTCT